MKKEDLEKELEKYNGIALVDFSGDGDIMLMHQGTGGHLLVYLETIIEEFPKEIDFRLIVRAVACGLAKRNALETTSQEKSKEEKVKEEFDLDKANEIVNKIKDLLKELK